MKRIMGVDYGDVRTGIAMTDLLGMMASGVCTLRANGNRSLIAQIKELAVQNDVGLFVVGNPINMDGSHGPRSEKACAFAKKLGEECGIEAVMFDERCSTMEAHQIMNITDTRGKKRKENVDTLSAQIILQNYLDYKKNTGK
ncbi:MAG: Holliday junction resolvase RuvX [Firmicutes bacterium]|nr:Holliday junction resolvase RuvX [Candidatus Colimorpha enterica]